MSASKPAFAALAFKAKTVSQALPPIDAILSQSNDLAAEKGIMTIVPSTASVPALSSTAVADTAKPKTVPSARTPRVAQKKDPLTRRLTVVLPAYLVDAVFKTAFSERTTARFVIANCLHKSGFHVEPEDLAEDLRREP